MKLHRILSALMLLTLLVMFFGVLHDSEASRGRVIILGFDGVDPDIVQNMINNGELPHLAQLAKAGTFKPLHSSNPPQSPTAWSSFATCTPPAEHGIFDFLRRDPKTYLPAVGFGRAKRPELLADGALKAPLTYQSERKGKAFWKVASEQGLRVKSLLVPFAYPVEELSESSYQLCGLDVQDLRGTQSTYFALSEDFQTQEQIGGGIRLPLHFEGNTARVQIPGLAPHRSRDFATVPLDLTVDREKRQVTFTVQGHTVNVKEGQWSPWMEWEFTLSPKYAAHAISRFVVREAGQLVRVYMTCLQYHPKKPLIPISYPDAYADELVERYGLYKTVGWSYDTKALEHDDIDEEIFLQDVRQTMAWREHLTLDELERGNFDLLLSAWTATDRVSHMFWRYRDPKHPLYNAEKAVQYGREVEKTYLKMDEIVGNVMAHMREGDLLMLLSDHGFHSFRYGFSVNTWLVRNGYLRVKNNADPKIAYTDKKYLRDFDWANSKAYGLGLGMIFLNREGREGQGIVSEEEAPALMKEIRTKLLEEKDPKTGEKIFNNVYTFPKVEGASAADAPDIQLGYADGYQTAKASAAGAAPKEWLEPNTSKWSGEHASSDVAITPGIFLCNQNVEAAPDLMDLGVTALRYLGVKTPASYQGKPLL